MQCNATAFFASRRVPTQAELLNVLSSRLFSSSKLGKTRLNLETATVEVCVEGTLAMHWRPLSSIKDCARVR